jgi:hypothetical protein
MIGHRAAHQAGSAPENAHAVWSVSRFVLNRQNAPRLQTGNEKSPSRRLSAISGLRVDDRLGNSAKSGFCLDRRPYNKNRKTGRVGFGNALRAGANGRILSAPTKAPVASISAICAALQRCEETRSRIEVHMKKRRYSVGELGRTRLPPSEGYWRVHCIHSISKISQRTSFTIMARVFRS